LRLSVLPETFKREHAAPRSADPDGSGRGDGPKAVAPNVPIEADRQGGMHLKGLRAAAGPDWASIEDRPDVLQALALALETQA
jgi:hypothetical protein